MPTQNIEACFVLWKPFERCENYGATSFYRSVSKVQKLIGQFAGALLLGFSNHKLKIYGLGCLAHWNSIRWLLAGFFHLAAHRTFTPKTCWSVFVFVVYCKHRWLICLQHIGVSKMYAFKKSTILCFSSICALPKRKKWSEMEWSTHTSTSTGSTGINNVSSFKRNETILLLLLFVESCVKSTREESIDWFQNTCTLAHSIIHTCVPYQIMLYLTINAVAYWLRVHTDVRIQHLQRQ